MGRPSLYTEEIADEICEGLMQGKSMREVCEPSGMPGASTVFAWLTREPSFQEKYAHAREVQAHMNADETREIVDNEPDPARARVRLDQRKWFAGRLLPRVYGDKLQHTGDGGGAVAVVMNVVTGVPRKVDEPNN